MSMLRRGFTLGFVVVLTLAVSSPWAISEQPNEDTRVPAFHAGPPAKDASLPPILGKDQLWGSNEQYPYQTHSYELAAKIPNVIYQQPCYCYCDRMGHKSLRSCFEGTHGAQCSTCMKELYYSYQMTRKNKSAAQIRSGIIAGEWKQIDLQSAASIN
ncbi:MAG TPA: CYCXC family (seleno)protein [Terriglobales bacterium]